jgi:ATP-dependent Clp protease adaptor protein ClpS
MKPMIPALQRKEKRAIAPVVEGDRATVQEVVRKPYPNYKVIVLNDDFNTFEHVASCLLKYIPGMTEALAWELTNRVHFEGLAVVWVGPLEPAELYHAQLRHEKLTMAPLEPA